MLYCINPSCQGRQNPEASEYCQACSTQLLINGRYRLVQPLRELHKSLYVEVFQAECTTLPYSCGLRSGYTNGGADGNTWGEEGLYPTPTLHEQGTSKVLKILKADDRDLVRLFEREAQVLIWLRHPGIPRVEPDGYFVLSLSNSSRELRCLVMEKVEGEDLQQWLRKHGSIPDQKLALDWLKQLAEILQQVHRYELFHRDIKPANIMLRPDGQLVLIDFGAARRVTQTVVEGREITRIYSYGYTAPEQVEGKAVPQSDFFALGRTFVHLLTGIHPEDLPRDPQTGQLVWRQRAPQISAGLAALIDDLMAPLLKRPQNPQVILDRLVESSSHQTIGACQILRNLRTVLLTSAMVTSFVIGVRYLGVLQALELQAFDQLLRVRPQEESDPRLLVITVTEADIQAQPARGRGSLSDLALSQLLKKLEQYQPRAIGLDIYRADPVGREYPDLARRLRSDRLVAVCKVSDPEANDPGVPPPAEVPLERLGFSDVVVDTDTSIRRQLLQLTPPAASRCATEYAFSLQLALHYLAPAGIQAQVTPEGYLQLGNVILKRLIAPAGGYQKVDTKGYQVLLNYRPYSTLQDIAPQVTLGDILNDQLPPDSIKKLQDRIVLIGVNAPSFGDYWSTPYSAGQQPAQRQIPGVLLQAQMVSQILSAVLDQRPLLWVWPQWGEALWIWSWALVGGLLAWCCRPLLRLGVIGGFALGTLSILCFGLFTQGAWVPLLPAAIALVMTGAGVVVYTRSRSDTSR